MTRLAIKHKTIILGNVLFILFSEHLIGKFLLPSLYVKITFSSLEFRLTKLQMHFLLLFQVSPNKI